MTSYCLDVNVWLALTFPFHVHHAEAARWLSSIGGNSRIIFSRYTQLGLLKLLTNTAVMGADTVSLGEAWAVYDRWLEDPRVELQLEPDGVDPVFRGVASPHFTKPASKVIGDCYLLAFARQSDATLVTFDKALFDLARKNRCDALIPC